MLAPRSLSVGRTVAAALPVALAAAVSALSPPAARAGDGDVAAGRLDLTVYFAYDQPFEGTWAAEGLAWRPVFDAFSERLWDATERQLQLGTVTFTARDELKSAADVWITDGAGGAAAHLSGLGVPGRHVTLSQVHRSSIGAVLGQFALVHGAGHYLFGLHDEYRGQLGTDPTAVQHPLHFCTQPGGAGAGSIMDGGAGLAPAHLRTEFCSPLEHNGGYADAAGQVVLTFQQAHHGASCWERMVASGVGALVAPLESPTSDASGHQPVTYVDADGGVAVVFVLDRSGSMLGDPLASTQQGAKVGVGLLPADAELALVSFNGTVTIDVPIAPADGPQVAATLAAIDSLVASGDTAIGSALIQAAGELGRVDVARRVVILLTDGANNSGPPRVSPEVLDPLVAGGVEVWALGLGAAFNPGDLTTVAATTGGRFVAAQDPAQLPALFAQLSAEARGARTAIESTAQALAAGAVADVPLEVDAAASELVVSLAFAAGAPLGLSLHAPDGATVHDALAFEPSPGVELFASDVQQVLTVAAPAAGAWTARVTSSAATATTLYDLAGQLATPTIDVTPEVLGGATAYPAPLAVRAAVVGSLPIAGAAVSARVRRPDGTLVPEPLSLFDDGLAIHGDDLAQDGVYAALFQDYAAAPSDDGSYTFTLSVDTAAGTAGGGAECPTAAAPAPPGGGDGGAAPATDVFRAVTSVSATLVGAPSGPTAAALALADPGLGLDGQTLVGDPPALAAALAVELAPGPGQPVDVAAVEVERTADGALGGLVEFALHLDVDRDGQPDNPAQPVVSVPAAAGGATLRFERPSGEPLFQLAPGAAPYLLVAVGAIAVPAWESGAPAAGATGGAGPGWPAGPLAGGVAVALALSALAVAARAASRRGERPGARAAGGLAWGAGLCGAAALAAASCSSGGGGGPGTVAPPTAASQMTLTLAPDGLVARGAIDGAPLAVTGAPVTVTTALD